MKDEMRTSGVSKRQLGRRRESLEGLTIIIGLMIVL